MILDLSPYILTPGKRVTERKDRRRLSKLAHEAKRARELQAAREVFAK